MIELESRSSAPSLNHHTRMATSSGPSSVPTHLSPTQLHRLNDYLEAKCLELTRGVRKRLEPESPYATLPAYLATSSSLVNMILLIPPSEGIRTSWLLRVTGDVFENIPAYQLETLLEAVVDDEEEKEQVPVLSEQGLEVLDRVFQLFDKLDAGWCAVIRNERWHPTEGHGIFEPSADKPSSESNPLNPSFSTTDRIRLRSLIISGKHELDDWLAEHGGGANFDIYQRSIRVMQHTLEEIGGDVPIPVPEEEDSEEDDYS
ncbi:unnamed protein product [Rhizoctonia solani]|uniref:Uncharacterized protein n=1 Tax=Rhizoctonia solani TaxID=456999 RepID=A0A8H3DIZ3_9AGAM|nr:unnamed protein product [Rhizoctonia solani]